MFSLNTFQHFGFSGNERADVLAKLAVKGCGENTLAIKDFPNSFYGSCGDPLMAEVNLLDFLVQKPGDDRSGFSSDKTSDISVVDSDSHSDHDSSHSSHIDNDTQSHTNSCSHSNHSPSFHFHSPSFDIVASSGDIEKVGNGDRSRGSLFRGGVGLPFSVQRSMGSVSSSVAPVGLDVVNSAAFSVDESRFVPPSEGSGADVDDSPVVQSEMSDDGDGSAVSEVADVDDFSVVQSKVSVDFGDAVAVSEVADVDDGGDADLGDGSVAVIRRYPRRVRKIYVPPFSVSGLKKGRPLVKKKLRCSL